MLKKDWRNLAIALGALAIVLALAVAIVLTLEFGPSAQATTQEKVVVQDQKQTELGETEEEVYAQGRAERDGEAVELFVLNPEAETQSQQRHPTIYEETRISSVPVTFELDIPVGYIGIVGGWAVNETENGVYRAFGPGHYAVKVTDGFALLIEEEWGQAEFDFRVEQAEQLGWAHETVDPGPLQ